MDTAPELAEAVAHLTAHGVEAVAHPADLGALDSAEAIVDA